MKWWTKGIIASVVVIVVCLAVGITVTDVVLKDKITPEQDEKISRSVGQATGGSLIVVWGVAFALHKRGMKGEPE